MSLGNYKTIVVNVPKKVRDIETQILLEKDKLEPFLDKMRPIQDKISELKEKKDKFYPNSTIQCTGLVGCGGKGCGKRSKIKDTTYVVTHWYTEPHGCTGGDYWNEGEHQLICTHCDGRIRLIYGNEFLKNKHKDIYKEVIKEHDDR